jgi:phage tail-like protein
MAEFTVNTSRRDPYRTFLFQVVMDGAVVAGVSKVGALKRTTEVVSHRPGNAIAHQFHSPGLTSHEAITLERGLTHDDTFYRWANEVYSPEGLGGVSLANYKRDIQINMLNLQGTVVKIFNVYRCWPSEFQAMPELSANDNAVAIELLTLQNEGWEMDEAVTEPTES